MAIYYSIHRKLYMNYLLIGWYLSRSGITSRPFRLLRYLIIINPIVCRKPGNKKKGRELLIWNSVSGNISLWDEWDPEEIWCGVPGVSNILDYSGDSYKHSWTVCVVLYLCTSLHIMIVRFFAPFCNWGIFYRIHEADLVYPSITDGHLNSVQLLMTVNNASFNLHGIVSGQHVVLILWPPTWEWMLQFSGH